MNETNSQDLQQENNYLMPPYSSSYSSINKNETLEQKLDFDQILEKIGFGLYQMRIFVAMGILGLSEGAQIQIYTLTLDIQKKEFNLSEDLKNLQSSLVFFAFLMGSFCSGLVSDKYGRAKPCLIASFLLTIFQTLISQSYTIVQLFSFRSISSFIIGFFAPLACTILAEITPSKNRGKFMAILAISFSLGQLFGVFLTYQCLSANLETGDWRLLIFLSCIPLVFSFILQLFYMDESPRFEFCSGDITQGIRIIDRICITNHQYNIDLLYNNARQDLILWSQKQKKSENNKFFMLLNDKYFKITLILWFNWITLSFSYFGIILYLPQILKQFGIEHDKDFNSIQIFYSVGIEILGLFLGALIIDLKYFGRKNSMIILFFLCSISSIFAFLQYNKFLFYATLSKIFLNNIMNFCFQYTSEVYPTQIRTTGIGIANGIGKSTGIFLPFICGNLELIQTGSSFIAFSIVCLISAILTYNLPYDTTGLSLDRKSSLSIIKQ